MATGGGQTRDGLLTKAAEYRTTAMQMNDPELVAAYMQMAAEAEENAEALAPRARPVRITRGTRRRGNR